MNFNQKTAIVVGGSGLIGKAIVKKLQECNARAVSIDSYNSDIDFYITKHSNLDELITVDFDMWINAAYPQTPQAHIECFYVGTEWACKYFQRRGAGGSIVNLSSIYGIVGPDDRLYEGTKIIMPSAYSLVKGAIISHSRCMAARYGKNAIRVNVVSPGGVFDNQPESFVRRYCEKVPLGRMARPQDVANAVVWLASDEAAYVTGCNLLVDGGITSVV